jgi:hypothetical protein
MLDREKILSSQDLETEEVEVPEWNGSVFIKGMTGTERDAFEQSIVDGKKTNLVNIRSKLLVKCICDENGERLFDEKDVDVLGAKSAAALDRLFEVAQGLNGMSASDVESMEKNSGSGQNDSSTSS